jgi:uncharacterized protein (DUF433 family)
MTTLEDRIAIDPHTCSGQPRIAGTRVRVSHLLAWLAEGMSEAEILAEYPQLTGADIKAALAFAAAQVQSRPPVRAE